MKHLSIGKMAKLNHVSEQTLRLYDKLGLLTPCYRDDSNNYRYYDIKQSARLDMIQYMKSLGMKLKDIKKQLDSNDLSMVQDILYKKQNQIDEQLKDLKLQSMAVKRTIESLKRYESSPPEGVILLEYIEKRHMYCIDSKINFYDFGIDVYEKILRELKESMVTAHLPQVYFFNAGSILRKDNLLQGKFISTEVFIFLDNEFIQNDLVSTIPANNYICIYCDCFHKEKEYANRLLDEIQKQGYIICGDYICEAITELPMIKNNERGMFLRLQIPIKFS